MFAIVLAVALSGQSPAAEAGGVASRPSATPKAKAGVGPFKPGEFFVYSEVMPAVPGAPTEAALDQILVRLGKNDLAGAIDLQTKGSGYLFCPPLLVKVVPGVAESRSAMYPSLRLTRVAVVEGPYRGKESWVPLANLRPAAEFPAHLASLAYAERVQDWRDEHMTPPPSDEAEHKAISAREAANRDAAKALIARRRAKRAAQYKATAAREAEDAKARALAAEAAKKEYREALPYMLEARGQELRRQTEMERNQVWNRYLNQGGAQGVIVGPAPQPVRIINEPGQPVVE